MAKQFEIQPNMRIGYVQAEADVSKYLDKCFIDTGLLDLLADCKNPQIILAGRTGAGKSALISRLTKLKDSQVIRIDPESLSLPYLSNSRTFQFFLETGVRMTPFYRLLWRHVLCVELLKLAIPDFQKDENRELKDSWRILFKSDEEYNDAVEYLRRWGDNFWIDAGQRAKEVAGNLENALLEVIEEVGLDKEKLGPEVIKTITKEQMAKISDHANNVVEQVQVKELDDIIDAVSKILQSEDNEYYLAIDHLDRDWVEDPHRFNLIRALIDTGEKLSGIPNLKVIIALRHDLIERVYRYTKDPGFQSEKFRDITLEITWSKSHLTGLLDARIENLIAEQIPGFEKPIYHTELLPSHIRGQKTIDYILERSLYRPREVIEFINECLKICVGYPTISEKKLLLAEGEYSQNRLHALFDEWRGVYPNLEHLHNLLLGQKRDFLFGELDYEEFDTNLFFAMDSGDLNPGVDAMLMSREYHGDMSQHEYVKSIIQIFYTVGLVGLKTDPGLNVSWSAVTGVSIPKAAITNLTRIYIHQVFWRALGIAKVVK